MKTFITTGTLQFLSNLKKKFPNENMLLMSNSTNTLILHETIGKTVFQAPRKYEVLDSSGSWDTASFIVFNNIPVTDEGRPVFEYQYKNRPRLIEKQPGFVAFRLLRPIGSDTYIVLTAWENAKSFEDWKNSASFESTQKMFSEAPGKKSSTIFSEAPYSAEYYIAEENQE
ncbi:antibiotic biosynthesis monooxygenase family protein [Mesobacillus harenae]|uniref:antibiotic biosynthesis monooxygenase family protein n=1 Tax=Mesobacillus harenae TaxID=2213203 RepID=UPI0015802FA5|nr:antibiotic biosynthesis monooxygenase [Mesobacillus harenae]